MIVEYKYCAVIYKNIKDTNFLFLKRGSLYSIFYIHLG